MQLDAPDGGADLLEETPPSATPETAPAPSPETEPPAADGPSESQSASDDAPPVPADAAPEPAPPPEPTFTPPPGEPFTLKIERQAVPIEGAVTTPDGGVYFSPDAWHRVRSAYIGDPRAWGRKEQAYQEQIRQQGQTRSNAEQRAEALTSKLVELFQNPEKLAAEFEHWQVNGPKLLAEAQVQATQRELEAYRQREQQAREAEAEAALEPELQNHLGLTVERWLALPDFQSVPQEAAVSLLRQLWGMHQRFGYHPQGLYQRGPQGVVLNEELVREELTRLAEQRRREQTVERKQATNQAAVAPKAPKPPGPTRTVAAAKPAATKAPAPNPADPGFDWDEWMKNRRYTE